jgi:hypothetical protein
MVSLFRSRGWGTVGRFIEAEFLDVIGTKVQSFPPFYSQSPLPPSPPLSKFGLKLVCNVNVVYGNLKSENSQDYAQKPQRNCMFINSAFGEDFFTWVACKKFVSCPRHFDWKNMPPLGPIKWLNSKPVGLF